MERGRSSFWFVPVIMAMGAIILSIFTLSIDRLLLQSTDIRAWLLYKGPGHYQARNLFRGGRRGI